MLITALLILVLLLGIRVWWRKTDDASNNAKDDNSSKASDAKDDDSSKASTSKLDKAKEIAQKAGKKAKNFLNAAAIIISSIFWWGVLIGMGYLLVSFGYSIYQDASDFMSNPTTTATPSVPVSVNRIVDGDYVPDKTHGTYLFTMDANKSYRIQVSGCGLVLLDDGTRYKIKPYRLKVCSDGAFPAHNNKKFIYSTKGAMFPDKYAGIAILVVKKNKKIIKKLPIGGNLFVLDGRGEVYLYTNLSSHVTVTSGEWHVVVDEI